MATNNFAEIRHNILEAARLAKRASQNKADQMNLALQKGLGPTNSLFTDISADLANNQEYGYSLRHRYEGSVPPSLSAELTGPPGILHRFKVLFVDDDLIQLRVVGLDEEASAALANSGGDQHNDVVDITIDAANEIAEAIGQTIARVISRT